MRRKLDWLQEEASHNSSRGRGGSGLVGSDPTGGFYMLERMLSDQKACHPWGGPQQAYLSEPAGGGLAPPPRCRGSSVHAITEEEASNLLPGSQSPLYKRREVGESCFSSPAFKKQLAGSLLLILERTGVLGLTFGGPTFCPLRNIMPG